MVCETCGGIMLAELLAAFIAENGKGLRLTHDRLARIEANQARLERALKAHGVGAWQEPA